MKPLSLLMLEGDGIGPEITAAMKAALAAARERFGLAFDIQEAKIGFAALETEGSTFPESVGEAAKRADGVIMGPVSHNDYPPRAEGGLNPSGEMRKRLELFSNLRPARTRPGLPSPTGREFDLVIVRENTEGFYADRTMFQGNGEFMPTPDLAMALRKVTREGSRRIAEAAFTQAKLRTAKKVTAVHKANVLRVSDGLFLEECRKVAAQHPDIAYEEQIVDAVAAYLIRDPGRFDVIVTTNMFGDILSDEASELSGGLGLAASINHGHHHCMAQAQHGSAPDIAGEDKANPTSLIGSVAMLLEWLSARHDVPACADAGRTMRQTLDDLLADPATRTKDLGGPLGTAAFGEAVAQRIAEG
jgi:isocitrate/isopropylmalate dehydrogenase